MNLILKIGKVDLRVGVAMLSLLMSSIANAQQPDTVQTYRCRSEISSGLDWKNDRWNPARFYPDGTFFLTVIKSENNVELQYKSDAREFFCRTGFNIQGMWGRLVTVRSCANQLGEVIVFSEQNLRGSTAALLGSTSKDANARDSLAVSPFICVAS